MRGCFTKMAAVAIVAIAIAGCASTATPRGYGGPPPLFKYQDGYAEDRSPYGPMPTNAGENSTIPGSRRYYWIPGSAEWYTFAGPNGPAGPGPPFQPTRPSCLIHRSYGAGGRIRTVDPALMRRVLSPTELLRQNCLFYSSS